ncbi:MAG: hypothetical protein DRR42_14135 [Gammaproteobacteria bacterium]|nr:MAG: hypothetical protein DRR42_14135 [Gammaproteobacteria bacterium]
MANIKLIPPGAAKARFTVAQLSIAFSIGAATVRRRLGPTPPVEMNGKKSYYELCDVATLIDVRDPYIPDEPKEPTVETDPNKMKPMDRKTYYQAEDLKQSAEIKFRRNALEAATLIPAEDVERVLAAAFKTIALTLDTLPDALERDGIISSTDVSYVLRIIDASREQLATTLGELAPEVEDINEEGDWS